MSETSHFVVVGGGTAGWIAAFILEDSARRRGLPIRVSVLESSKVPTVGVGEATTAAFRLFLKYFGIDEFAFLKATEASLKLGIRHEDWRRKGVTYYGPIDDPHQVVQAPSGAPSDYLNVYAVGAGKPVQDMHMFQPLLERWKAPYAQRSDGTLLPLGPFHYAYHFDQALVGRYFAQRARGVSHIDGLVADVERDGESGDITALVLEDGERIAGDFFIDATGFRKALIGKAMGGRWHSYADALPVNRALPFWIEHEAGAEIPPYTRAWAQNNGWMWQIPTQSRYGCGYVYCDAFCSPEDAKAEGEMALGCEIETRGDIRFSIGRLEDVWIGNCLAVGLSSSFLEPLESTSIHGTIVQMMLFARRYFDRPGAMTARGRSDYNRRVARQVDDFRTFVNMHYVTERDDTPFWREVRATRIHPETRARLAAWREQMPRRAHFPDYLDGLPHIETQLYYPVLDGLGLLDPAIAKAEMAQAPQLRSFARKTYESLTREYKQAATRAMGHAAFLAHVRDSA